MSVFYELAKTYFYHLLALNPFHCVEDNITLSSALRLLDSTYVTASGQGDVILCTLVNLQTCDGN